MGMNAPDPQARPLQGAPDGQAARENPHFSLPGLEPTHQSMGAVGQGLSDLGANLANATGAVAKLWLDHKRQSDDAALVDLKLQHNTTQEALSEQMQTDPNIQKGALDGTMLEKMGAARQNAVVQLRGSDTYKNLPHKQQQEFDFYTREQGVPLAHQDFEDQIRSESSVKDARFKLGMNSIKNQIYTRGANIQNMQLGLEMVDASRTSMDTDETMALKRQAASTDMASWNVDGKLDTLMVAIEGLNGQPSDDAISRVKDMFKYVTTLSDRKGQIQSLVDYYGKASHQDPNALANEIQSNKAQAEKNGLPSLLATEQALQQVGISKDMLMTLGPDAVHTAITRLSSMQNELESRAKAVHDRTLQQTRSFFHDELPGYLSSAFTQGTIPDMANKKMTWLETNGEPGGDDARTVTAARQALKWGVYVHSQIAQDKQLADIYDDISKRANPDDPRYKGKKDGESMAAWGLVDSTVRSIISSSGQGADKPGTAEAYSAVPAGRAFAEAKNVPGSIDYIAGRQKSDGVALAPLNTKQAAALGPVAHQMAQRRDEEPDQAAAAMEGLLSQITAMAPEKTAWGLQKRQAILSQVLQAGSADQDEASAYYALQQSLEGKGTPELRAVAVQSTDHLRELANKVNKDTSVVDREGQPRLLANTELRTRVPAYDAFLQTDGALNTGLGRATQASFEKVYLYNIQRGRSQADAVKLAEQAIFPNHTGRLIRGKMTMTNLNDNFTDQQVWLAGRRLAEQMRDQTAHINAPLDRSTRLVLEDNLSRLQNGNFRIQLLPGNAGYGIQVNTDASGATEKYRPVIGLDKKPMVLTAKQIQDLSAQWLSVHKPAAPAKPYNFDIRSK